MRRRADKEAFDVKLTDAVVVRYEDFILKGAKTTVQTRMPKQDGGDARAAEPVRGSEVVPRRVGLTLEDLLNMATLRDAQAARSHKQGLDQSVTTAKLAD